MADPVPTWFCLRSKPRRQNLAAAHLRSFGIEVLNPQLRFRRPTRQGPAWTTTALFPNYLFARFEFEHAFRRVRYAMGVSDIVNFGRRWVSVPDAEIAQLQRLWGEDEALALPERIEVGHPVILTGGLFHGMEAQVVALLPARQRVKVLLEFLGGLTETEVAATAVLPAVKNPLAV